MRIKIVTGYGQLMKNGIEVERYNLPLGIHHFPDDVTVIQLSKSEFESLSDVDNSDNMSRRHAIRNLINKPNKTLDDRVTILELMSKLK